MYREELINEIQMSNDKEYRGQLLAEFYFANLGLTVILCDKFCKQSAYRNDMLQIAYFALNKAVTDYNPEKGFSFLSYYRMCLRHECYVFWKDMCVAEEILSDPLNYIVGDESETREMFARVEIDFMNQLLWEHLESVLNTVESDMVRKRFLYKQTLREIAKDYGMTIEGVRRKIKRLCIHLRDDERLQEIAKYYGF